MTAFPRGFLRQPRVIALLAARPDEEPVRLVETREETYQRAIARWWKETEGMK